MKRLLTSIVAALMLSLTAGAQERLYVCHHDSCEVYETSNIGSITFQNDSFCIDGQLPYPVSQVDSMVFKLPASLTIEERGWWGNMQEGESRFTTTLTCKLSNTSFDCHVQFILTALDSICQNVVCELTLDEERHINLFFLFGGELTEESGGNDPYIYVKETLTGPRRFETWTMGDPVLPEGCVWEATTDSLVIRSDCSMFLAGRPMDEVKQIVEAWLFQPLIQIEKE